MRLADVAEALGCRLEGDGGADITGVGSLETAGPRELTFVSEARHLPRLTASAAGAVIVAEGWPSADRPALRTADPLLAFGRALALFYPPRAPRPGIHATAVLAPDARVSPEAEIGPLCVLEAGAVVGPGTILEAHVFVGAGVRIGAACRLFPQVTLREGTRLGDRVILHSGVVIGADGFGYAREGVRRVKIPQVGCVVIEDDVEVGANATIDRATLGETRIGRGTKIDNLVQIGHNVRVGPDVVIVAQVGISGSSEVGARATLAGQAGVVDHVRIGDDAIVGAQAGVSKDVPAGGIVLGSPAGPHQEFKRQLAALARLPELRKAVQALEARLRAVEARRDG
ncbi:MAG TPA: UDP-3-O-(3-hydroxymyristoyl)glucosamine N-acyltransferase [Candidatus Sulfotelmatobacter sp.]|nr:UDP-3-O-(3-hydroxymyristoyl)glucosamine N-acyltransferase [Candidatus Sulfotelmatobacter sp.]